MIDAQSIEKEKTQEGESQPKRLTSKQIKFIVGGLIIAAVVGYMVVSAAQESTVAGGTGPW